MRLKPSTWALLSALLFVGGIVFWKLGDRQMAAKRGANTSERGGVVTNGVSSKPVANSAPEIVVLPVALIESSSFDAVKAAVKNPKDPLRYRLGNTEKSAGQLGRSETGLLLRNALIDTAAGQALAIPDELRSREDGGAYIVQAREKLNDAFREQLLAANAEIISYVPNNAYLVRVSNDGAQKIAGLPQTQSVLPYEPFFKLDHPVLSRAIEDKPFEPGAKLRVTLFPGYEKSAADELAKLGVQIVGKERSPFGPELVVRMPVETLIAVAQLPGVQNVEFSTERIAANDMARERVGVSTNTIDLVNILGLTGTNVLVNVNDGGVDASHPDLTNRVFVGARTFNTDIDGHGTHVAGIIASSGESGPVPGTNAVGSLGMANFRGMAPKSRVLSLDVFEFFDWEIQETAARTNWFVFGRTNALISNNSWVYVNSYGYNSSAASFDAAVRDSIPGVTGSQPVLFVFAAGNDGGGNLSGSDGFANSINSPGTAKNVITVGALEQPRGITNWIFITNATPGGSNVVSSNLTYLARTDSSNEVAFYSGRGNVGIRMEGDFGRLKPDVVAPGSFLVSTRSGQWDTNSYYNPTNIDSRRYTNFVIKAGQTNFFSISVPDNTVELWIDALPTSVLAPELPPLLLYTNAAAPRPSTNAANFAATNSLHLNHQDDGFERSVELYFDFVNTNSADVTYDIRTVIFSTNNYGNELDILEELNEKLVGPNSPPPRYRYESGTSMAAPVVSGMLALLQEYLETKISPAVSNASPALMKALLINGSRSAGPLYELNTEVGFNAQGWGLPRLGRMLPGTSQASASLLFFDQSQTNALATDEVQTRELYVTEDAQFAPIRVSLVWTDPPGNPAVGIKLVNDLDLVVTNLDTGDVYFGNYFPGGGDFSSVNLFQEETNAPPVVLNGERDIVNNVENIYLNSPVGTRYAVSVIGRRVNVNAVTTQPDGIRQDYALVISSGDLTITNALSVSNFVSSSAVTANVTSLTNTTGGPAGSGFSLSIRNGERVGANNPYELQTQTNGTLNQWRFYAFTNTAGYSNLAFAVFGTRNLSGVSTHDYQVPSLRNFDADIDLFVSTNANLLTLNSNVISFESLKGVTRGGNELIVITNTAPAAGDVYYIGVKSEDQRSADYNLLAIASEVPFASQDGTGFRPIFFPLPAVIPDGSPFDPGTVEMLGIMPQDFDIRRLIVTTAFDHQLFGDLVGVFSRYGGRKEVYLNNHGPMDGQSSGIVTNLYNDLNEGDTPEAVTTDGPGSLADYVGDQAYGLWSFAVTDNALSHTGQVLNVSFVAEPQPTEPVDGSEMITPTICRTIFANSQRYDSVRVPVGSTNLTVFAAFPAGSGPIEVYLRRGRIPTTAEYDHKAVLPAPGGSLSVGLGDVPSLTRGTYYIMLRNPGANAVEVCWYKRIGRDLTGSALDTVTVTNQVPLVDDALTNLTISVTNQGLVSQVQVGVRIDHPRVADLSMHLVSPSGTRILLFENRGWQTTNGLGNDSQVGTNFVDIMNSSFEGVPAGNYSSTAVDGWTVGLQAISILDYPGKALHGLNFVDLNDAAITRMLPTVAGRNYRLSYGYSGIVTNLVKNPGFESGAVDWVFDPETGVSGPRTNITAFEGNNFAILRTNSGNGKSISQNIPVVGGRSYTLEFYTAPVGPGPQPAILQYTAVTTANLNMSLANTNWRKVTHVFTAPAGSSTVNLRFRDNGGPNQAVVIDMVSIYPTPEATVGLVGVTTNSHLGGASWQTHTVAFTAPANGTSLTVTPLDRGMWFDRFILTEEQISSPVTHFVFTERTNDVVDFVKFAQPPFGSGTNSFVFVNRFETVGASNYSVGSAVEGWGVTATNVAIDAEPAFANSDTNVLAINTKPGSTNGPDGSIVRTIPSSPGSSFLLNFAHRRPHSSLVNWWSGNSTTADSIGSQSATLNNGATYASHVVGNGFSFDGVNDSATFGTSVGNFGTNDFTIEFWMNATAADNYSYLLGKRVACGCSSFWNICLGHDLLSNGKIQVEMSAGGSCVLYNAFVSTRVVADGANHHIAVARKGTLVSLYIDGILDSSNSTAQVMDLTNTAQMTAANSPCVPGNSRKFYRGRLDEIGFHNRAISPREINSLFLAGSAGRFDSSNPPTNAPASRSFTVVEGITNRFNSGNIWSNYSTLITPAGTSFDIVISGETNGVWIDNLSLTKFAPQIYHPEESLDLLVGEPAFGDWTLEVWDTRLGAALNSKVVSWQLDLDLFRQVIDPPVVQVQDGTTFSNSVVSNAISYFIVQVPSDATAATNTLSSLTGGNLELLFNQSSLPTGSGAGDLSFLTTTTTGNYILDQVGSTPALVPGQRYYLGVRNVNPAESNNFTLKVDFSVTPGTVNVPSLTNGVPFTNSIPVGFAMQYYQYVVPANALFVDFEIINPTGDVNLFLRKGTPLPTYNSADYASQNINAANEFIRVTPSSQPVPLSPGVWYIGVLNQTTTPVDYELLVTEPTIINLVSGVPQNGVSLSTPYMRTFYKLVIDQSNPSVLFEAVNLSGNADLVVKKDSLPTASEFDFISANPGTNHEQIVVSTNPVPSLNGDWYIGVPNNTGFSVDYTVHAVVTTNGILPSVLPLEIFSLNLSGGLLSFEWNSVETQKYQVQSSPDLLFWDPVAAPLTATNRVSNFIAPIQNVPTLFYRVEQLP